MNGRSIKRGDILLIEFPHSDLRGTAVRPALVLSNDQHNAANADLVCLMISSQVGKARADDLVLSSTDPDFQQTGLRYDSVFRVSRLQALEKTIVQRYLGRASDRVLGEVGKGVAKLLELETTS